MEAKADQILETVNSIADEEQLMDYAATLGIQTSLGVQFRLFQLRNPRYDHAFVQERLDALLEHLQLDMFQGRISQDEIRDIHRAYLVDEEMVESEGILTQDGEWDISQIQTGEGDEPQPGPSHEPDTQQKLKYTMEKWTERVYAKNAAVDRTYRVKVDEEHRGQKLQDVTEGLHDMFEDILTQARGTLADNDLGRIVVHHEGLHDPVVVPLQPWDQLDATSVLQTLERVLNSNQELSINASFEITVGTIDLPKGGGAKRLITRLKGLKNSLEVKKSIVTIENNDQLCMARAIGVSWAKLRKCSSEEWSEITKKRGKKTNVQLILKSEKAPESFYKKLTDKKRNEQRQLAVALSQMAGVPLDRPASLNDIEAFEDLLGVRIMVVCAKLGNKFITSPRNDERPCIYVYLTDEDHFHAITRITGFFSASYFCSKCLKHYNNREKHRCDETCIICKTDRCPVVDQPRKCSDCNMNCRSEECYDRHKEVPLHKKGKKKGKPRGLSQCQKWWKCPTCYKVVRTDRREKEDHQCGEYYCTSCEDYVMDDHLCFLRAKDCKEDYIPKFIFFDFECSQDTVSACRDGYRPVTEPTCTECQPEKVCKRCSKCSHCKTSWCGQTTHRPNLVVAQTVCPKCIDEELTPDSICRGCGTRCEECDKTDLYDNEDEGPCKGKCGFREVVFQGENTAEQFGQWLFSDQHEHFKVFAHNMKGYDGYFLLEYLIDQSIRPDKILYNGSKIMYMAVERGLNIKVLDSLNFLPMKLAALPKAFGLAGMKKGWFPHYFNTKENQQYVGPYPPPETYGAAFMSGQERGDLLAWLEEQKNETFDFREAILEYCRSDVTILRQACLKFRDLLMHVTGEETETVNEKGKKEKKWVGAVDPFDSTTIASVCMNVYRTKFLEEVWRVQLDDIDDWIPSKRSDGTLYVSQNGEWIVEDVLNVTKREFVNTPIAKLTPNGYRDQYSKVSIQWLKWMAHTEEVDIQHALNRGEKSIPGTRYKLDGYCAETNTVYEYHGCVFHGCPVCFSENREEVRHPLTNQSMDELYAVTLKKKTYLENLGMRYVCIWDHQFKEQCDQDLELKQFIQQLDVSDRLDPRESFFGGRTNASKLYYKVEEPGTKVQYSDFTSLYPYTNKYCRYPKGHPTIITEGFKDMKEYFGIAKVKILPPRRLYHPVLPYKSNGKLTFPLCKTCADTENPDSCSCSEEERALTGTWCTPEIQTALRLGYSLLKVYEVYHWEETTQYYPTTGEGGLFAQYINTFLKIKQEASGPPDWVKTKQDMSMYIQQYEEKEGVSLDRKNIVKNAGMRALAKLCLNSFWGKFGQRLNMRQTEMLHEGQANQFFQLLTDPMKQTLDFHILSNDMIQVEWVYKRDCQPEDNKTNVYIATFTTAWARLKLYSVLEQLDTRVLYYDTDSVIYVSRPGEAEPPLGDYLGELTNELNSDDHIVEFVSGGPKNYAYRTNKNEETCKVRGFTLNYANSRLINFESVKSLVTDSKSNPEIKITNPSKICRDKRKRKLYNREEQKVYQMVYTKRRRVENYDTVPYGY